MRGRARRRAALRRLAPLLALALGAAGSATSEEPPETASLLDALKPFAPLVGPTWVAEMPSEGWSDVQEFEWVYGGKFLRNRHRVRDPRGEVAYEGETIYAWDAPEAKLVWWYWNSTGGYVTGTAEVEEAVVKTEGENHAGGDQTPRVKGELHVGEEGWVSISFYFEDGAWVRARELRYFPRP